MREFNIFGPVYPQCHYHVNRVAVKAALRTKIEQGRYLTLTGSRQTGKTTLAREIIAELEAEGDYVGISLKAFMEEHGVRLLKSEKSQRPLEISGQYLLFSYLTAALQSVGGY